MEIGHRIRDLRQRIGLTQAELAERSDLTKGFISLIENNNTSPSLNALENIVEALGTTLAEFFSEDDTSPLVFHREDAFCAKYDSLGMQMYWLVANAQKNQMEPVIVVLEQDGRSKEYEPFEGECFGYVLQGKILLHYGEEKHLLSVSDSFSFDAKQKFSIKNAGEEEAQVLWVSTPPMF